MNEVKFELKALVKEAFKLQCIRLHDGKMSAIYGIGTGFKCPVPVAEMDNGTFNAEESGFTLMKWIKREIKALEAPDEENSEPVVADAPTTVIVDLTK